MELKRRSKYLAPAAFYRMVAIIAVPLVIQQIVQNTLGAVDTVMVSSITGGVVAVAIAAQFENILNSVGFGINAGTSIYAAQYYGAKQLDQLKRVFGMQIILNIVGGLLFVLAALFFGEKVLSFYNSDPEIIALAMTYLKAVIYAYIPAMMSFAFAFMYRTIQKTMVPLIIGIGVMVVNVFLNYTLVFGKFGAPALGVQGAAIATSVATILGMLIHIGYAIKTKQPFIGSFKQMFSLDTKFVKPILMKSLPIMLNETIFGLGMSLYMKAFGLLGTGAQESYKIGSQIAMFFFPVVTGMNAAMSSIIGSELGKRNLARVKEYSRYFLGIAVSVAIVISVLIVSSAPFLVSLFYNGVTTSLAYEHTVLLTQLFSIRIALRLLNSFVFAMLRAGGDSMFLLLLDGGVMWLFGIPLCFVAVKYFGVATVPMLFAVNQIEQIIRIGIGAKRYQSGKWLNVLIGDKKMDKLQ